MTVARAAVESREHAPPERIATPSVRHVAGIVWLALLPAVLLVLFYYGPVLWSGRTLDVWGDARYYLYQVWRAAELDGRWWQAAVNEPVGRPYPSVVAKLPQLYEGLDLLLLSTLTSRLFSPHANYFVLIAVVLMLNGWIAGWLALRMTGSFFWASLAVALITLNHSTAARMSGHLHFFKHGWLLLALWGFSRYLDEPSPSSGAKLGLAAVLVLAGSFYIGYLMSVVFAAWWLGALLAGRLGRRHVGATLAAGAVIALLVPLVAFPVWTVARNQPFSGGLFRRLPEETWIYGSQLWQYVVSPEWPIAATFARLHGPDPGEGWHYPGVTMLLAAVVYVFHRLRNVAPSSADERLLRRGFGVVAGLIFLSLSGGISAFLYYLEPNFRAYGRAGIMAIGVWAVMAVIVFAGTIRRMRSRAVRGALSLAVVLLVAYDGYHAARFFKPDGAPIPAWVSWLARQPADVRAAPFPDPRKPVIDWDNIYFHVIHRHETLIGCEMNLFRKDLALLGADYDRLREPALLFVVSLGYETLIFDPGYLELHPWIPGLDWLEYRERLEDGWLVYRAKSDAPRFRAAELRDLVSEYGGRTELEQVPVASWITDRFDLPGPTVITDREWARLVWIDAEGRQLRRPKTALYQRYFSPSAPAFTVQTPARAGPYRLLFLDARGRILAERPYRVVDVPSGARGARSLRNAVQGTGVIDVGTGGRLIVENRSAYYLQVHTRRSPDLGWERFQPASGEPEEGSLYLRVNLRDAAPAATEMRLLLPRDLPPHGSVSLNLPETALGSAGRAVEIAPQFAGVATTGAASAAVIARMAR